VTAQPVCTLPGHRPSRHHLCVVRSGVCGDFGPSVRSIDPQLEVKGCDLQQLHVEAQQSRHGRPRATAACSRLADRGWAGYWAGFVACIPRRGVVARGAGPVVAAGSVQRVEEPGVPPRQVSGGQVSTVRQPGWRRAGCRRGGVVCMHCQVDRCTQAHGAPTPLSLPPPQRPRSRSCRRCVCVCGRAALQPLSFRFPPPGRAWMVTRRCRLPPSSW